MTIHICLLILLVAAVSAAHPDTDIDVHRKLSSLEEQWGIDLLSAVALSDEISVALTFMHGSGGTPSYKIYGKEFDASLEVAGETCRSQGGLEQDTGFDLLLETNAESTESVLRATIADKSNLPPILLQQPAEQTETFIQYCVLFSLLNEAGEEVTVLETEIRVTEGQDGTISVGNIMPTRAQPLAREFSTTWGVTASLCRAPNGQNKVVSVCIVSDNPSLYQIDSITSFAFRGTGTPEDITQVAFYNGVGGAMTDIVAGDDGTYQFDTLLKAEFYQQGTIMVVGEGSCILVTNSPGQTRRRLQINSPTLGGIPSGVANQREPADESMEAMIEEEEEEEVLLGLSFVIETDEDQQAVLLPGASTIAGTSSGSSTTGSSPIESHGAPTSTTTSLSMSTLSILVSCFATAVSLVALAFMCRTRGLLTALGDHLMMTKDSNSSSSTTDKPQEPTEQMWKSQRQNKMEDINHAPTQDSESDDDWI